MRARLQPSVGLYYGDGTTLFWQTNEIVCDFASCKAHLLKHFNSRHYSLP